MRPEGTLPEMNELAEQIGEFIHYWGFKRVHGRIWTHLFLAQKPLDAADLVRQMKISKALVSISIRELLEYEVIEEVGKSSRGTHLYRTNPDILKVILSVLRQREKRMLSRMSAAQEALEKVSADEREKHGLSEKHLSQLFGLITRASMGLEGFIAMKSVDFGDWRQAFITTDLREEAELRAKSVVGPSTRTGSGHTENEATRGDENRGGMKPTLSSGSGFGGPLNGSLSGPLTADGEPILASGKGVGFRR